MAEYLIFFNDEWVTDATDEEWQTRSRDVRAVVEEMKAAGAFIFTGGLDNEADVFHVEPRDGKPVFTDGPYAETKETFGGFAAVDVPDEATARYWAGRVAMACDWPQEVRIFRTPTQVPTPDADSAAAAPRRPEMAQYLLSVHAVDSEFDPAAGKFGAYASAEEADAALAATGIFNQKLVAEGHFVFAGGLRSASTATVVDATGDRPMFTDGPYLETKERIGGFWVIDAPDLDVALELAVEGSRACRGTVEVRPFAG